MSVYNEARALESGDYNKGYLSLLSELTVVGDVSEEQFQARLERMEQAGASCVVVDDLSAPDGALAACGTVLFIPKFTHNCGEVALIEDVAVRADCQSHGLGAKVIQALVAKARARSGCYKIILNCNESKMAFYEKCGFRRKELQMALYFDEKS